MAGDVLLLGMAGAGKTLLARQLNALARGGDPGCGGRIAADAVPTVGVELLRLPGKTPKTATLVREVGGAMQPVWPQYYPGCRAFVFVVDASDASRLAAAADALFGLLAAPELAGCAVLVVLNKCDAPAVVPPPVLESALHLRALLARPGVMDSGVTDSGTPGSGVPGAVIAGAGRVSLLGDASAYHGRGVPDVLAWIQGLHA